MAETIEYNPSLVIRNLEGLPRGTGSRFLECIRSHTGELIAKQWRRTLTPGIQASAEVLVKF
jgi:hypothetical protein